MNKAPLARSLHKWLGLVVGLQVFVWLASGLYMVIVDLDFIHGDPLVRNMQQPLIIPDASKPGVATLRGRYPAATHIGLRAVLGDTFYTITTPTERLLFDPANDAVVSPLSEARARDIAAFHFNGEARIRAARLIVSDPPQEIQSRRLPLWRIDFDDRFATSFYIDPYSGRLVTRRHDYWRIFDFLWMLHIMDYDERSDAHNPLLIAAEASAAIFAFTGLWLLFYSFSRRRSKRRGT